MRARCSAPSIAATSARLIEALARGDGAALLAEVQELDRDAPDYDRALVELAAFLQRIAIVQIVPEAAAQDEEFDAALLTQLAQAISPEDAQLYYQIALGGRRDLRMAPEPRIGLRNDTVAHAGISAGCVRQQLLSAPAAGVAATDAAQLPAGTSAAAAPGPQRPAIAHPDDHRCGQLAGGGRSGEFERHGASARLELRAGEPSSTTC